MADRQTLTWAGWMSDIWVGIAQFAQFVAEILWNVLQLVPFSISSKYSPPTSKYCRNPQPATRSPRPAPRPAPSRLVVSGSESGTLCRSLDEGSNKPQFGMRDIW